MNEQPRRRRPLLLIALPILLSRALVMLLYLILTRIIWPPSAWRAKVDEYLAYRGGLSYVSASHATLPGEFSADMSAATFGDSPYYQTDYHRGPVSGPRPLPYPPDDVWCVSLAAAGGRTVTIFMARHIDLYNADWITHELAGDPARAKTQVGCR